MKKFAIPFGLILFLSFTVSCKPGEPGILNCGSTLRGYKGGPDVLIADFNEKIAALEKDEDTKSRSLTRLGQLYAQLGPEYNEKRMWDKAIASFEKAISYGNQNNILLYHMAISFANRGKDSGNTADYDTAEKYYLKSLELNPKYHEAKYGLAILLFYEKNERERAVALMEDVAESNPSFYMGRFALGKFLYETGEKQSSLAVFEKLNSDLAKLPESEASAMYLKNSRDSITRIMSELGRTQKK